jgi:TonB family protein
VALASQSSDLSLADLLQVKGQSRGSCCILLQGQRGPGCLFLNEGVVVHAEYAGLVGESAAHALLWEEMLSIRVTSGAPPPSPNMAVEHRTLVFRAAVLADESRRTRTPPPPPPSEVGSNQDLITRAPAPAPAAPDPPPARRPSRRGAWASFLAAAAVGAGGTALVMTAMRKTPRAADAIQPMPPAALAPAPTPPAAPLEASALSPPKDHLPVLLSGQLPRSPAPDLPLRPTVILRLLVDETGAVARAEVYQPRADLAAFEQAALRAAAHFSFRPALREGARVAVWINWPVDFT